MRITSENFYDPDWFKYVPKWIREQLKMLYSMYFDKPWWNIAWLNYKNYVIRARKEGVTPWDMRWPGPVAFNKYLKQEFEKNQKESGKPKSLGGGLFQCLNCGKSFLADMIDTCACPSCGIKFVKFGNYGFKEEDWL